MLEEMSILIQWIILKKSSHSSRSIEKHIQHKDRTSLKAKLLRALAA
jgi:hypothetical protein